MRWELLPGTLRELFQGTSRSTLLWQRCVGSAELHLEIEIAEQAHELHPFLSARNRTIAVVVVVDVADSDPIVAGDVSAAFFAPVGVGGFRWRVRGGAAIDDVESGRGSRKRSDLRNVEIEVLALVLRVGCQS